MASTEKGKLTFPCEFTFKIIGLANNEFETEVLMIIHQHFPQISEGALTTKPSANGKYLAYSVTVNAKSQEQLNAAYEMLSKSPLILFVL